MGVSAGNCDILALLYLLVDCGVPTNMVLRAIQRAVDANWEVHLENFHGEISTLDLALQIRELELDRGLSSKVMHRSNHMYVLKHYGVVWQRRNRERCYGAQRESHFKSL
jgi:hypothetical protein